MIVASSVSDSNFMCIGRITDDDNNNCADTITLIITNNAPTIDAIRSDTVIGVLDSIWFFGTVSDIDSNIVEYSWDYNGDGIFDSNDSISIMQKYCFTKAGLYHSILRVSDGGNLFAYDTVLVTVMQDIPLIDAGKDTAVYINDTIRLHATSTQQFGGPKKWEWNINNNGFIQTSSSDTTILAPSVPDSNFICIARVTDTHGNIVTDTINATIYLGAPSVNLTTNGKLFAENDTIILFAEVFDSNGTIINYEWDIGNSGTYILGSDLQSLSTNQVNLDNYLCIVKVTDEDMVTAYDTIIIRREDSEIKGSRISLQFIDNSTGFLLTSFDNKKRLYRTRNGGNSWCLRNASVPGTDMHFINDSIGYIAMTSISESNCLQKTQNGGLTWKNYWSQSHTQSRNRSSVSYGPFISGRDRVFLYRRASMGEISFLSIKKDDDGILTDYGYPQTSAYYYTISLTVINGDHLGWLNYGYYLGGIIIFYKSIYNTNSKSWDNTAVTRPIIGVSDSSLDNSSYPGCIYNDSTMFYFSSDKTKNGGTISVYKGYGTEGTWELVGEINNLGSDNPNSSYSIRASCDSLQIAITTNVGRYVSENEGKNWIKQEINDDIPISSVVKMFIVE